MMDFSVLLITVIVLALVFDFINGFHDAANSIATIVSTKVLTPLQAVVWAALFNFVAFFIFKDHGVANTIAKTVKEEHITLGVITAGLIAAIIWNLATWWWGIPSSSSHTLIGGLAGAAIAHAGIGSIEQDKILVTAGFIVIAPVAGLLMAYLISAWFLNSFRKGPTMKIVSIGVFGLVGLMLYYQLEFDPQKLKTHFESYWLKVIFSGGNFKWILLAFVMSVMAGFTMFLSNLNAYRATVWFKRMQLVSSAAFSIGHGGNDAQKVMGVITAALIASGTIVDFEQMPNWVPLACYSAIALGTISGGWKIVKTMGTKITKVTPFEGVAAETAGAITLFLTENLKIPVSTTHTITGSIIGVGLTKRVAAVKWGITGKLLIAWVITIPISGLMGAIAFYICKVFGL